MEQRYIMSNPDIRWHQRLSNFDAALTQLSDAAQLASERELSLLEQQGVIQAFEFTHELAWKVMKDYAYYQGNNAITGSRDACREAFKMGLLNHAEVWMEMITSRNQSSHTYNRSVAKQIIERVLSRYHTEFKAFYAHMVYLKNE
jgi:nucleotidyltransferase substrate binding protein (TIGR01987 family)